MVVRAWLVVTSSYVYSYDTSNISLFLSLFPIPPFQSVNLVAESLPDLRDQDHVTTMAPKRARAASVKKTDAPAIVSASPEPKRSPEARVRRSAVKEAEQEHGYEFFGPYAH